MAEVVLKVTLNGTAENPWHRMGLTQNPFPQIGHAEYDAAERRLNKLGGDPIKDVQQIRDTLQGYFTDDFIELCCAQFKPGEMVHFQITFDDKS